MRVLRPASSQLCPQCGTGAMRPVTVTFAHWFEGQFITIPNFPAQVCDVCGERQYDANALEQLETILGPDADFRRESARRTPRGSARRPLPRPSNRRRIA